MSTRWIPWRATRELLTPAEMGEADAATIRGGVAGTTLMERAGEAVAEAAARLALPGSRATPRIAVLCGPGNNGGDGYVAARLLARRGLQATAFALGDPTRLKGDAAWAFAAWGRATRPLTDYAPEDFDLVIDALFGAGLARDLEGEARRAVEQVNGWRAARGGKVVAVDVPSGLDGATGQVRGAAIEADVSVTFFRLKPGHVLLPGRRLCGELRLADIGVAPGALAAISPATFLNGPALWGAALPRPQPEGHKYARGHAVVVSGPRFHTGAARLAARAATRIGAGLVTVAGSPYALAEHAAHITAIMTAPVEDAADLARLMADPRRNALIIGPGLGLGRASRALVEAALAPAPGRGLVLDADALTHFSGDLAGLRRFVTAQGGAVVLTPHGGEYARLVKGLSLKPESPSQVVESGSEDAKPARALRLARAAGSVVLLKGPDTVVAAPDGRASIAADLPPDLATAGSGDVLAGMIGGLLAQGMPAFEGASAAAWLHGAAARQLGRGLTADDLPETIGQALSSL